MIEALRALEKEMRGQAHDGPTQDWRPNMVAFADRLAILATASEQAPDHATAMEAWFTAIDDADELFVNAPDERFASRAARVSAFLKLRRPTSPAHTSEARDARYFADGPEGHFYAETADFANRLIVAAGYDRDDWTVTDLFNPTGIAAMRQEAGSRE